MSLTVTVLVDAEPDVTTQMLLDDVHSLLKGYKGLKRISVHRNTGSVRGDRARVTIDVKDPRCMNGRG